MGERPGLTGGTPGRDAYGAGAGRELRHPRPVGNDPHADVGHARSHERRLGGLPSDGRSGGDDARARPCACLPEPSPDGKTYTFHLRQGISYSNGEPVRPEDFRRAIERVFTNLDANGDSSPGVAYMSGIVVAMPARPEFLQPVEGDRNRRRRGHADVPPDRASADLLYRLALPFAFAVPADTPNRLGKPAVPGAGAVCRGALHGGQGDRVRRQSSFHPVACEAERVPGYDRLRLGSDPRRMAADVLGGGFDSCSRASIQMSSTSSPGTMPASSI